MLPDRVHETVGSIAPAQAPGVDGGFLERKSPSRLPVPPAIPETYRQLRRWLSFIIGIFFRRIEVIGLENVPNDRGGVLVAWHPNGLIDPALIMTCFPRHVVFGARHTLFKYPLLGRFVRALGTVPIYRRMDTAEGAVDQARSRNDQSLDALADTIANGAFSALFPEGYSHDTPYLREIKTGAARLYYRARARTPAGRPAPVVIPVGLHYDQKRVFRSGVLIEFHKPIELPIDIDVTPAPDEDPEKLRDLAHKLTARIETVLKTVILETDSWELHRVLQRARKLVRAERAARAGVSAGGSTLDERLLGLARIWVAYNDRLKIRPTEIAALRERVERYDRDLRGLRIEDHELDEPPPIEPWFWVIITAQLTSVLLLLPPFLLIGYIVNLPPAALVMLIARFVGKEEKDMASLKLLAGVVFFPATWALWGWLAYKGVVRYQAIFSWMPDNAILAALLMVILSMVGAFVLMIYFGLAFSTWRALRVRFTRGRRARSLLRLRVERSRLCDDLLAMAAGIELPGVVTPEGRVTRAVR